MTRRNFIKKTSATALLLSTTGLPLWAMDKPKVEKLTILHTNDVHSRINPFPMDGGRNAGMGGAAKRAALIQKVRKAEQHVLLLDSGDIFQGTPFFNYFGGELEFKLMSQMQYDVATLGNHDFDAGIDGLVKQMPLASFSFVNANYDFRDTALEGKILPYKIIQKGNIKIGILGVGLELDGLVPAKLYGKIKYEDPIANANKTAALLKQELKCDFVICLSHLGYKYQSDKVSDIVLAKNSANIDLILGGHTHTFMKQPDEGRNAEGKPIMIHQAGWAGILLGRLDIYFEKNAPNKCATCESIYIK